MKYIANELANLDVERVEFSTIKEQLAVEEYSGNVYDIVVDGISNYLTPVGFAHNGGGKRKGSIAMYIEPWHEEILAFLKAKDPHGIEKTRARDLFYAIFFNDLFFERLIRNEKWTLFDPAEVPDLPDLFDSPEDKAFTRRYEEYEKQFPNATRISAQELFAAIHDSEMKNGTPYLLSKDACNSKSNQKNLGTIKSSNLCAEIVEYTSEDEVAVCNLSSISLPAYIRPEVHEKLDKYLSDVYQDPSTPYPFEKITDVYDFNLLHSKVRRVTKNLDRIIEVNYYPVERAKVSNFKNRPIGIGVQGLADLFAILKLPFTSPLAKELNKVIAETIYFSALTESHAMALAKGKYETFEGSPLSKGIFQFDMWTERTVKVTTEKMYIEKEEPVRLSGLWDWEDLRSKIVKDGVRNSLVMALMPTASTSQILGNFESFEPPTGNIFNRTLSSGEFIVVNKHIVTDLVKLGIWNDSVRKQIILDGTIKNVETIPNFLKEIYKTVWEIRNQDLIDMSTDRAYFVDQSQSFNLYFPDIEYQVYRTTIIYAYLKGLKTLQYYCRSKPATSANKGLGIDTSDRADTKKQTYEEYVKSIQAMTSSEEGCEMCSS